MSNFDSYNNYIGYHNFMKFWAKNGQYNWIANTQACPNGQLDSTKLEHKVNYPYTNKTFWNDYGKDDTRSPLTNLIDNTIIWN